MRVQEPHIVCESSPGNPIPEGQRNAALTSLAGAMRRKGMTKEAIQAALLAENAARYQPPLPEAEVAAIAASVHSYAPDNDVVAQPRQYPSLRAGDDWKDAMRTAIQEELRVLEAENAALPEPAESQ